MEAAGPPGRTARFSIQLFLTVLFVYLLSGPPFLGYDGGIMYQVSEHLVTRHSLLVQDPIYHQSEPYSPYGIGTSLLLLPFVLVGYLLVHDPAALIMLYLPIITALTVVFVDRILVELGIRSIRALWLSLAFAFATMAWHYVGVLFSEPLVMLTSAAAWLWILVYRRTSQRRWLLLVGAMLGLAVLAREASVLLTALPLSAYAGWLIFRRQRAWRARVLDSLALGALLAVGCGASLAYDVVRYGRPLAGPYFKSWAWLSTPLPKGVFGLLLSPGGGLFVFVPLLLLSLVGFPLFVKRWRTEALLIAGIVCLNLVFYGTWYDWEGGATWGPRYLLPLIPFLMAPIGFLEGRRWQVIIIGAATLSLGIEVLCQLVPYGLYYGQVVPDVAARLGICHCTPPPDRAMVAVQDVIHFDWRYAVLPFQLRAALQGIVAPAWGPIGFVLIPVLAVDAILFWRLRRLAPLSTSG